MKSKKLLTQIKSKYYMLKVNYPNLAEKVDNDPIILDEQQDQPQKQNLDGKVKHQRMAEKIISLDI